MVCLYLLICCFGSAKQITIIITGAQCALLTKPFTVMQKALIICFCLNEPRKDWNIAAGLGSYHFPGFIFAFALNNEASSLVAFSLHWPGFTVCMDGGLRSAWWTLDGEWIHWDFSPKFFSYFEEPSSTCFLPLFLSRMLLTHILDKILQNRHGKMSKRKGNHFTHLKYCQMILSTKVSVNSQITKFSSSRCSSGFEEIQLHVLSLVEDKISLVENLYHCTVQAVLWISFLLLTKSQSYPVIYLRGTILWISALVCWYFYHCKSEQNLLLLVTSEQNHSLSMHSAMYMLQDSAHPRVITYICI